MSDPSIQGKMNLTSQIQHLLKGKKKVPSSGSISISEDDASPIISPDSLPESVATPDLSTMLPAVNDNKFLLNKEALERVSLVNDSEYNYLYPSLNDPNFNIKISEKKEFYDTQYNGDIYNIEEQGDILCNTPFELAPHQIFVRNFLSFQTPYNGLLLFHGLGSGKTCSAISVAEEMRDYLKQMGISQRIIIVASPNVQENFKLQLFDSNKLQETNGIWNIRACTGTKYLKEINPINLKGLTRDKIISQITRLINASYLFLGYIEFANLIQRKMATAGELTAKKRNDIEVKKLQKFFNSRLIIIDEIHNIRLSDDNQNKRVATMLTKLVHSVSNLRLLLLSATPMYNSYKEIIWLINLLNINDNRGTITYKDIFDKDENLLLNIDGEEIGKMRLIEKATGYVSFVRGDNPYTFPYKIYPDYFALPEHLLKTYDYPKRQLNGRPIVQPLQYLDLFLTNIGDYQHMGYNYIIDQLKQASASIENLPNFENMEAFGYTLLQEPLEALNMIYPDDILNDYINQKQVSQSGGVNPISSASNTGSSSADSSSSDDSSSDDSSDSNAALGRAENSSVALGSTALGSSSDDSSSDDSSSDDSSSDDSSEDDRSEVLVPIPTTTTPQPTPQPTSQPTSQPIPQPTSQHTDILPQERGSGGLTPNDYEQSRHSSTSTALERGSRVETPSKILISLEKQELTGKKGLRRIMTYEERVNPPERYNYEYRPEMEAKYGRIFSLSEIGKYSSKISNICNIVKKSKGIILIYSQWLDGGIIPMALALEEMGFLRYKYRSLLKTRPEHLLDSKRMTLSKKTQIDKIAKYTMITGDKMFSPNNAETIRALTQENNVNGEEIKVILITRAGSEGLDFSNIRQVHVMEPWYNMNRIEQIIGRGVRNCSHKKLPFSQRNVQIFLHGTLLSSNYLELSDEAADLYLYRLAELKAIQIGRVTRVLKEAAIDCILNHAQQNLTAENFNTKVQQHISTGETINYQVGDKPYTATCDYMERCSYQCIPHLELKDDHVKLDSYSENFIVLNTERIIQRIKSLFKGKYFYKKENLLREINILSEYPLFQIYAALDRLVTIEGEFLTDKYNRLGKLVNIGDYYFFQPIEIINKEISIFDRSVPIAYKAPNITIKQSDKIDESIVVKVKLTESPTADVLVVTDTRAKILIADLYINYKKATTFQELKGRSDDWYIFCSFTIARLNNSGIDMTILSQILISHILEELIYDTKVIILEYLYTQKDLTEFEKSLKDYFDNKILRYKHLIGLILENNKKQQLLIFKTDQWIKAEAEDYRDLADEIKKLIIPINSLNNIVGFMTNFKNKYMVFKVKDLLLKRHTGARCDQAGKASTIKQLNKIVNKETYTLSNTEDIMQLELCSLEEFILRYFSLQKKDDKIWYLDPINALLNKIEQLTKYK